MLDELLALAMANTWLLTTSLAMGGLGAWVVGRYANSIGLIDEPNERSSHSKPTPKGGGVGILLAFVIAGFKLGFPLMFLLAVTGLSLVSFVGDNIHLSPLFRLVVQFVAALVALHSLNEHKLITILNEQNNIFILAGLISAATIFIVSTANFYNFMDGINGIAGLTGIISFLFLALYGLYNGTPNYLVLLSLVLCISCIGFLPFNFPRARIFMGDVGSVLLGFMFATVVVATAKSFEEFTLLAAFMFLFYADELVTMIERIKDGWNLTRPHRRHLYQVLANEVGIPHWEVSIFYVLFQALANIIFWKTFQHGFLYFMLILLISFISFIVLNNFIKKTYQIVSQNENYT